MTSLVVGAIVGNEILSNSVRRSTTTIYQSIIDILGSNADEKFKNTIEEQEKCKIAINNIELSLCLIEEEIETIKKGIETHEAKYFKYFRYCDYKRNVDNLVKYVKILNSRFDLLIKVMN